MLITILLSLCKNADVILVGISKHHACINWQCWRRQFSTFFL